MSQPLQRPDDEASPRTHLPRAEEFLFWPPALQVYGYRIVDQLFASRPVRRGDSPRPLRRGKEVTVRYQVDDRTLGVGDFIDRNRLTGLLVIQDGQVRLEHYALGLQPADRWSSMSTVKSITAMLAGAAIHDGRMSLEDPIIRYLPSLAGSAYEGVLIRHVLTMSSGVGWTEVYEDPTSNVNQYSKSLADKVPGGVLRLMRSLPAGHQPGSVWHYNSGDTYLLGAAITAAVQKPLADYLSEKIWQPCGMEFDAYYTLESPGGQEIGGSRAGIALRDFGRFASLVLDDGVVDGQRILAEGYVATSGAAAFSFTATNFDANPLLAAGRMSGYGLSWFIDRDGAMIASGFAGQRIYVNRAERMAIVTLGAFPQPGFIGTKEHNHIAEVVTFTDAVRAALR